eukprot:7949275-Pyramimonas_sp.AAC.1
MGHGTCKRCTGTGATLTCELRHWEFRWSYLRGHDTCEGVCRNGRGAHMPIAPPGPSAELPLGSRS